MQKDFLQDKRISQLKNRKEREEKQAIVGLVSQERRFETNY